MRPVNATAASLTGGVAFALDLDHPAHFLLFTFHYVFATSAVLLAGTVVVGILATEALLTQNRFIFMLNTSICDTMTGLSVYYLGLFDVNEGHPNRNGTYNVIPSLLGVNILTFLFAQFDRYFAICHPFLYRRFVTRWVVICTVLFCWVDVYAQQIAVIFLPLSKAVQVYGFSVVSLQFIVLTKIIMTIKLYIVANYQLKRDPPGVERDNKKESLTIVIFVVISFLALWSPSFINIILRFIFRRGVQFRNESTNPFAIMARLNALTTPAIYVWSSPALRAAVRGIWARSCPCRRVRFAKK